MRLVDWWIAEDRRRLRSVGGWNTATGALTAVMLVFLVAPSLEDQESVAVMAFLVGWALVHIVGGVGAMLGQRWSVFVLYPVASMDLFGFPLLTALGVYTLWVLHDAPPGRFLSGEHDTVLPPLPDDTADIAALREGLQSPHAEMREHCASIIGDRGPEALAAVPELEVLLRDPVRRVRARAKWALETITRRHRR